MKAFQGLKFKQHVLSTDGICIEDMQLSKEFSFRTFDCGGQVNFLPTNQLFITQNAVRFFLVFLLCNSLMLCLIFQIFMIVFDLRSVNYQSVINWLLNIVTPCKSTRVPPIIIVATHADHFSSFPGMLFLFCKFCNLL